MKPPIFISSFADDLIAYIDFKARTGKTGHSRIYYLRHFDTWATRHSITKLDRGAVEGWVADELTHCSTHRSWMSYIRDFGRWMRIHRDPSAHVLGDEWKAGIVHSTPYLMSSTDIEAFFTATRTVPAHSPWAWQATAFFLLMHSAGLRTREVRALTPANVDFNDRHIMIATSKSGRGTQTPPHRRSHGHSRFLPPPLSFSVPQPPTVLRLVHRCRSQRLIDRSNVQPYLGSRRPGPASRRTPTTVLRLPAPFRLRQY